MPLYMDVHDHVEELTADAVTAAHQKALEVRSRYGVKYLPYWFDKGTGTVFCLVEAPNREAATDLHRAAHGLFADRVIVVKKGH
jgi:Nickel responsive protein SCO4226-like